MTKKNRKYIAEAALNVYVDEYALIPVNELQTFKPKTNYNIYCILATNRIKLTRCQIIDSEKLILTIKYGIKSFDYPFCTKVYTEDSLNSSKFNITNSGKNFEVILSEKDLVYIQNNFGSLMNKKCQNGVLKIIYDATYFLYQLFIKNDLIMDYDLLYVGQSYGSDNNRNATARLKNHSTLQTIMADYMAEKPDKMVYAMLLSINDPLLIMGFDGMLKEASCSIDEDKEHLLKVLENANNDFHFKQVVNIIEALLIHYFQPKYSIKLKNNFPNRNGTSYQDYFSLDYNRVNFEFFPEAETLPKMRLITDTKRFSSGIISYILHNDKNRKSIFDIFDFNETINH